MADHTPTTSETLLREAAANPGSPREEEFARLYEPVMRRYVAQSRLDGRVIQPADRDDLVQEAFIAVRSALPGFRYDPVHGRFRNYLRRAVRTAVLRLRNRREVPAGNRVSDSPDPSPAPDGSEELALQVWTLALARVFRSGRFTPNTVAAFRRLVLDEAPVDDVACEFKLKPNAIYQLKNRVLRAVRAELARIGAGRLSIEDLAEALIAAEGEGG